MTFEQRYANDLATWDRCAVDYEQVIVNGHPDVRAYEDFEEDFLDSLLGFMLRKGHGPIRLLDVGCGSARLHLHYGLKMTPPGSNMRERGIPFDPLIATGIEGVDGVDFSQEMLDIAGKKLDNAEIPLGIQKKLRIRQGSAFDPAPDFVEGLPVAVSVCNTIGVMQGLEGAQKLFKSLRKEVEEAGGVAVISAYRRDAVSAFALGNYESTMNVSGQPYWLRPARFSTHEVIPVPLQIKRAFDSDPHIRVVEQDHVGRHLGECVLERDPTTVNEVIATGHIRTLWGYESYWYPVEQFAEWINTEWNGLAAWHIDGRQIDALRAWPAQLAVLDVEDRLARFFNRLGIKRGA